MSRNLLASGLIDELSRAADFCTVLCVNLGNFQPGTVLGNVFVSFFGDGTRSSE